MKDDQILDLVDLEIDDWKYYGLLGQRLSEIRKKVTLPPMYVISSTVFKDLLENDHIPDEKHIPWNMELEIAKRFEEFESPTARLLSSASYEYSLQPFITAGSKSDLIIGIDSIYRSFCGDEEAKTRERMGVPQFDLSIIIQKLMDPKTSGRMTQTEKDTKIIAVHGLPIDLEDADTYIVNEEGELTYHAESEQKKKWVLGDEEIESEDIRKSSWDDPKMTDKQVSRLANMGKTILELCGEEMAVEWYLVRNTFYVASLYPTKIVVVER
jgi:phosphoenolpyruvate synthase/pyruvate phosphate dikinase